MNTLKSLLYTVVEKSKVKLCFMNTLKPLLYTVVAEMYA